MGSPPRMLYLGTSGWQYRHWREAFYPKGLAQVKWLEYFMDRFRTVEINNAFYRLPPRETFEKWRDPTPTPSSTSTTIPVRARCGMLAGSMRPPLGLGSARLAYQERTK